MSLKTIVTMKLNFKFFKMPEDGHVHYSMLDTLYKSIIYLSVMSPIIFLVYTK